jgi:hypothetical protein
MSMTVSPLQKPKRRRFLWLAVLVVLFIAYSASWFYFANRVRAEIGGTIAALNAKGVNADCANLAVSGYPIRFVVSCDNTAYEDDAGNVAVSTGAITAVAPIYRPLSPVATIIGPLRTSAPGMPPLWLDWDHMRVATGLSWPVQQKISLQADGFSAQTDPQDDTDPVQLFSAGEARTELRPNGQDLDANASFKELQVDPEAIGGRMLPPLDGNLSATLKNGLALLAAPANSLRGRSIDITQLDLSSGTAHIAVAGPISVDADGLIDADLAIKLQDPKATATILGNAIPEQRRQIEQGFAALALLGSEPAMPLKIVKGKASLGFIPLGRIKPVE